MTQPLPEGAPASARLAGLSPLDYMLTVINDPAASVTRRDRMAIAAAPYVHPRAGDFKRGKKVRQAEAARQAGASSEWADDLKYQPGGRRMRQ